MASGHHYRTAQFYVVSTNICQHFLHVLDWVACTLLGLTTKTASEGSADENLTTNWIHLVLKVIFFCWIFAIVSISLHLSLYYKCSRLSSLKRTFFSFINMNFFLEQKKVLQMHDFATWLVLIFTVQVIYLVHYFSKALTNFETSIFWNAVVSLTTMVYVSGFHLALAGIKYCH